MSYGNDEDINILDLGKVPVPNTAPRPSPVPQQLPPQPQPIQSQPIQPGQFQQAQPVAQPFIQPVAQPTAQTIPQPTIQIQTPINTPASFVMPHDPNAPGFNQKQKPVRMQFTGASKPSRERVPAPPGSGFITRALYATGLVKSNAGVITVQLIIAAIFFSLSIYFFLSNI